MSVSKKLAVLIDAENISAEVVTDLFEQINRLGTACVKRIYGDWTDNKLNKWKSTLNAYAINPIQQFSYVNGKNATDMALVIDAMDLLHDNHVDGFCLVSSDSDFTRLASRIRENGLMVFGFGQKQTPHSFIQACDQFNLLHLAPTASLCTSFQTPMPANTKTNPPQPTAAKTLQKTPTESKQITTTITKPIQPLIPLIQTAIEKQIHNNAQAWASLDKVRGELNKTIPKFSPNHYGFKQFHTLVASLHQQFELKKNNLLYQIRLQPLETQTPSKKTQIPANASANAPKRWTKEELNANQAFIQALHQAIQKHIDLDGWAPLGAVACTLGKKTTKPFGYAKTSVLFAQIQSIQLRKKGNFYFLKRI